MAEPVIIVKENPGKLRIEVYDESGAMVGDLTCPSIPFSNADSDLDIDGTKFKTKSHGNHGDSVEIKVRTPKK